MARPRKTSVAPAEPKPYQHPEAESPARPEIGAQAHFKGGKAPSTYRYDSSLAPELRWDGLNGAREQGEALIADILADLRAARDAVAAGGGTPSAEALAALVQAEGRVEVLKSLSRPFLNWAGKAERLSFEVPTLPLFVHERLSTSAILATLKGHKKTKMVSADFLDSLFGAPEQPLADQVLRPDFLHGLVACHVPNKRLVFGIVHTVASLATFLEVELAA